MNTRRTRSLLVAPVLVLALGSLSACGASDDSAADTTTGTESTSSAPDSAGGTVALTADGSAAAKCAMPSAETLATFDTAFSGTVTALDGGTATLSVDQWYAGGDGADTVTVQSPSKDLEDLLLAVDFEEGKTYLVSATDTRVTLCGFTAEESPELQAMYDEAYTQ